LLSARGVGPLVSNPGINPVVPDRVEVVVAQVTMYTTEWCGHCRRLKRQLNEAGIDVVEVDVDVNREHDARIREASGGYRTVPTVEIGADLLVNPTILEVRAALGR
jgi:mycoredoxin